MNFNDLLDINLNILVWSLWEGKKEVNDILSNEMSNIAPIVINETVSNNIIDTSVNENQNTIENETNNNLKNI